MKALQHEQRPEVDDVPHAVQETGIAVDPVAKEEQAHAVGVGREECVEDVRASHQAYVPVVENGQQVLKSLSLTWRQAQRYPPKPLFRGSFSVPNFQ